MCIILVMIVSMMVVSCISLNKYLLGNGVYYNNNYGIGIYTTPTTTLPLYQPTPLPEIKNKVYIITNPNSPYNYDKIYPSNAYSNF